MNAQNINTQQITLDNKSKQKLALAYMSLYDALVAQYQSQNMTLGKSWYNALSKMHEILKSQKTDKPNQALDYLMNFYNSHRQIQSKKMMTAPNKDLTVPTSDDIARAATTKVDYEIEHLNKIMKSVSEIEVLVVLNKPKQQPANSFYDWVDKQPEEIVVDFDEPRSLERAYKRYVFQQKYRK